MRVLFSVAICLGLSGVLVAADADPRHAQSVTATATVTVQVVAPAASSSEIAVSKLDLSLAAQGGYKARADRSTAGKPITLGGVVYPQGLGTHAKFRMAIDCHGTAKRFTATVGLDDAGANKKYPPAAIFRVEGDGKKLWMSPMMHVGDVPLQIDVDLTGVKQLVLWLRDAKGGDGNDHGDWANATISYEGAVPVAVDRYPHSSTI